MIYCLMAWLSANPEQANAVGAIASAVAAILGLVVSGAALFLTFASLRHQRDHNKLSVRPLPMISVADYEDRLTVKLVNNGIGPLVVSKLAVAGPGPESGAVIDCMPALPANVDWSTFVGDISGRSIPANGELILLELRGDREDPPFQRGRAAVRRALAPLTVRIEFTDMYTTRFATYEKRLDWFGRPLK